MNNDKKINICKIIQYIQHIKLIAVLLINTIRIVINIYTIRIVIKIRAEKSGAQKETKIGGGGL